MKILLHLFLLFSLLYQPAWADLVIKKSRSSICHAPDSASYSRTKNFKPYSTIEDCLASGGRLPKGQQHDTSPSNATAQHKSSLVKYKRNYFGHGWDDEDRDCQNTRQEVLISTSTTSVRFADDQKCRVTFGRWISMYSGEILFDASKVDIDHVVPLKWAWEHGAQNWSKNKREQFANDPINLAPVEASLNRSKGAKGLDEWLPPANQVQYKARFQRIVLKYGLHN